MYHAGVPQPISVDFVTRRVIPGAIMTLCVDQAVSRETHATLDDLFKYAGAPGDPPDGSKYFKAQAWLRRVNADRAVDALEVLGKIIENYMDSPLDPRSLPDKPKAVWREKLITVLAEHKLQYKRGGRVTSALGTPTRRLEEFIRQRDIAAIEQEFDRAAESVDAEPREAVSAASNILESVCKTYVEDEHLDMPAKQDLQSVWNVVRKHLGFDPSRVEDDDLKSILTGLISIVHGVGALRTHASSAHGAGQKAYRLEGRHARLAVHAAHTLCLFILESWDRNKQGASR
jgi:hypothetical protein